MIQRNSAENIMKPNILQTLLNGRKKRDVEELDAEMLDNRVDAREDNLQERTKLIELLGKYTKIITHKKHGNKMVMVYYFLLQVKVA